MQPEHVERTKKSGTFNASLPRDAMQLEDLTDTSWAQGFQRFPYQRSNASAWNEPKVIQIRSLNAPLAREAMQRPTLQYSSRSHDFQRLSCQRSNATTMTGANPSGARSFNASLPRDAMQRPQQIDKPRGLYFQRISSQRCNATLAEKPFRIRGPLRIFSEILRKSSFCISYLIICES